MRGVFFTIAKMCNLFFDLVLLHIELSVYWWVGSNITKFWLRGTNWFLASFFGKSGTCHDLIILTVSSKFVRISLILVFLFSFLQVWDACMWHSQRVLEYSLPYWHSLDITIFSQHCTRIALSIYGRRVYAAYVDINFRITDKNLHWILK